MSPTSTRQKVGLALAGLLNAASVPSVLVPAPEGEVGPPFAILVASTVLGLIGLVATIAAWRSGARAMIRITAGALILNALIGLPALFVDIPPALKVTAGLGVLVTVLAVILMFSPARRSTLPVLDGADR
jgi:hypothetical protein